MRITNKFLLLACAFLTSITLWSADVTVTTYDSQGNPIAGTFKVKLGPNYVKHLGSSTIPSGTTLDLNSGDTYTIWAEYDHTSTDRMSLTVDPAGHLIDYHTTNVKFHFSGGYLNYRGSGSWKSFGKTAGEWNDRELFPNDFNGNPMRIQTGYKWNDTRTIEFDIDYAGKTSIEKTLAVLRVLDHAGNPIEGSKARGGYTTIGWHVPGSTNSDGLLIDIVHGEKHSLLYEARVNGTTSTIGPKDPTVDSYYLFQTAELRARMETCSGDPVDGGTVRFKNGLYKYWLNNNVAGNSNTGDAGPGEAAGEVFPGTYDVDMLFRYGQVTQTAVVTAAGGSTTFKTTNVALSYSGGITYKAAGGTYSAHYIKPDMEFLPGDYEFMFSGGGTVPVTVGPCASPIVINAVFVKLESSTGSGIAGATAKYYNSGWQNAGLTDANGLALINDPGISGNTKFRIEHAGHANEKWQDISSDAVVIFQTELVSMSLVESDGTTHLNGTAKYYGSGWKTFGSGTTPTNMELLPTNTKFRVEHGGLSAEKWQNTGGDPDVVFQTELVSMSLVESDGTTHLNGTAKYYGSGWKTFGGGTTQTTMELLANNIKFRVEYGGHSNEKWQDVGADPNVVFQTVLVNFVLKNSHNTQFLTPDATKYYGSGWKNFTAPDMELLPGNIKFRVEYRGHNNQKWQDVGSDPNVQFNTQKRVLSITNTTYGLQPGVYKWKYYGSGWNDLNPSNPSYTSTITYSNLSKKLQTYSELLPGNVKFRVETPCGNADQWSTASHITIDVPCDLSASSIVSGKNNILEQADFIRLYPNPASSQVTVEANGTVNIFNSTGQLMFTGETKIIDVSEWSPGVYLVRTATQVEKLIIK